MTAATLTLTDFLLARIAEDESVAKSFAADPKGIFEKHGGSSLRWYALMQGRPYREAKARVIAECAAKRTIVDLHDTAHYCTNGDMQPPVGPPYFGGGDERYPTCRTLRALASVYADHPDFRREWES